MNKRDLKDYYYTYKALYEFSLSKLYYVYDKMSYQLLYKHVLVLLTLTKN